jgi:hypothetical protein
MLLQHTPTQPNQLGLVQQPHNQAMLGLDKAPTSLAQKAKHIRKQSY